MRRIAGLSVGLLAAAWLAAGVADPPARLRHPVAAVPLADGRTLAVANRRSGTISLVDLAAGRVRDEIAVGDGLADLAALPDRRHLLAVDAEAYALIVLADGGGQLNVVTRLPVGSDPVSVAVTGDGRLATVTDQWSRHVIVIDVSAPAAPHVVHTIRLPFSPRLQCPLPGGTRVAVADAFVGGLAVVDAASGRLVAAHELRGHNLRGLHISADGRELLIAHQILDETTPTTLENVRGGVLMANVLRRVPVDRLIVPGADVNGGEVIRLGGVGAGAGDPASLAVLDGGTVVVCLAGVGEVALLPADGGTVRRIPVGRRPTALTAGPRGQIVAVNTLDDSLSVIDPRRAAVARTIALGVQPPLTDRDKGERHFYDARLSPDGWMSCNSCHPEGHTTGLLCDTLGDGSYGTPKRTLTLMGTRLTDPWGWTGQFRYLHDQTEQSLRQTMHTAAVTPDLIRELDTFQSSLPPPPPAEPVSDDPADQALVDRGRRVFEAHDCGQCHVPPLTYSSHGVHDVGFADERGVRRFNPPSLRGVGHGRRFLHDGRAKSLAEVFTKYRHQVGDGVEGDDLAALVRFLRSI